MFKIEYVFGKIGKNPTLWISTDCAGLDSFNHNKWGITVLQAQQLE